MAKDDHWVAAVLSCEREAFVTRHVAAVASEAAQQRNEACLDTAWPAWWLGIGAALEGVADAAAGVMGRPFFRVFGGGADPWVLGLVADPGQASIRFVADLAAPAAVRVTTAAPARGRQGELRYIVVDGDRLQVGGAKDAGAFVRAMVDPWLRMVCPLALAREADVLGRAAV